MQSTQNRHASDIGRLAIAFGDLEVVANVLAWNLIGRQAPGPAITEGMSIGQVGELMKRIVDSTYGAGFATRRRAEIAEVCDDLARVSAVRNEVIHGLWSDADEGHPADGSKSWLIEQIYAEQQPRRLEPAAVPTLLDAVDELVQRISAIDLQLMNALPPAA
jgi:hypothetical protein